MGGSGGISAGCRPCLGVTGACTRKPSSRNQAAVRPDQSIQHGVDLHSSREESKDRSSRVEPERMTGRRSRRQMAQPPSPRTPTAVPSAAVSVKSRESSRQAIGRIAAASHGKALGCSPDTRDDRSPGGAIDRIRDGSSLADQQRPEDGRPASGASTGFVGGFGNPGEVILPPPATRVAPRGPRSWQIGSYPFPGRRERPRPCRRACSSRLEKTDAARPPAHVPRRPSGRDFPDSCADDIGERRAAAA